MKRDNQSYSCHDDEYTNEALNREYYDRPCTMSSQSEGCKAYVRNRLQYRPHPLEVQGRELDGVTDTVTRRYEQQGI